MELREVNEILSSTVDMLKEGEWDDWFKVTSAEKKVQAEYEKWQRIGAKLFNNNLLKRMIYGERILEDKAFDRVNGLLKRERDPYKTMKLKTRWGKIFVRLVGETKRRLGKDVILKKYGKETWSELLKDAPWRKLIKDREET